MWVDRAWRTTTGRTDVVLAVADSGVDWSERSLLNKYALNQAELPLPMDGDGVEYDTHDANENQPRVALMAHRVTHHRHIITPMALMARPSASSSSSRS